MIRRMFQLDPRLAQCAAMVREGCKVVDLGTDHGYLPIWLAKQGKVKKAIATDVNVKPLQKAAGNVRKYKVTSLVDIRISDGLEVVFPPEVDDIVMAGMGGDLIIQIIGSAPWLKDPEKHLILQPMSSIPDLRRFLAREGYAVQEEQAVIADNRVYTVMLASYDPFQVPKDPLYPYIGLLDDQTPAGKQYLQREVFHLHNQAEGLCRAGRQQEAQPVFSVLDKIKERFPNLI